MVVQLPDGMDAAYIAATAARHGTSSSHLDHYRADHERPSPSALVIGYSRLTPHQIEDGIRRLASII